MIAVQQSEHDALEHLTRALERIQRHAAPFTSEPDDTLVDRASRVTEGLRTVLGLHWAPAVIFAPTYDPSDFTGGE